MEFLSRGVLLLVVLVLFSSNGVYSKRQGGLLQPINEGANNRPSQAAPTVGPSRGTGSGTGLLQPLATGNVYNSHSSSKGSALSGPSHGVSNLDHTLQFQGTSGNGGTRATRRPPGSFGSSAIQPATSGNTLNSGQSGVPGLSSPPVGGGGGGGRPSSSSISSQTGSSPAGIGSGVGSSASSSSSGSSSSQSGSSSSTPGNQNDINLGGFAGFGSNNQGSSSSNPETGNKKKPSNPQPYNGGGNHAQTVVASHLLMWLAVVSSLMTFVLTPFTCQW